MSSGPKNVTSTTNSAPPAYLEGSLKRIADAADRDYGMSFFGGPSRPTPVGAGGGRDYRGVPIANAAGAFGGPTYQYGTNLQGGYNSPRQLVPGAQELLGQTIQGKFLSPGSNPYLDATFERGADRITNRLNTNFARSGRDLAAARPAAADDLGTFASELYGDNLRFERMNQIQAIGDTLAFDPLNLYVNRLAGITPGAGGTTQSVQPVFRTGLF